MMSAVTECQITEWTQFDLIRCEPWTNPRQLCVYFLIFFSSFYLFLCYFQYSHVWSADFTHLYQAVMWNWIWHISISWYTGAADDYLYDLFMLDYGRKKMFFLWVFFVCLFFVVVFFIFWHLLTFSDFMFHFPWHVVLPLFILVSFIIHYRYTKEIVETQFTMMYHDLWWDLMISSNHPFGCTEVQNTVALIV